MYCQSRCMEKKNGVNRQRRNNSIDQILCLISQNTTETFKMIGMCCTVVEQIVQWYFKMVCEISDGGT